MSVLLSSHLLDRVQSVCDRVALFNEGNIALMGTVPELGRQVLGGGFHVEVEAEGQGLAERLAAVPGVQKVEPAGPDRCGFSPTATCGRKRRRRSSRQADVFCVSRSRSRASRPIYTRYFQKRPSKETVMRREGSALHGLGVVILKELNDHLTSARMRVLEWLVVLFAFVAALWRNPADQGRDRGRSVPVPAAVHDLARTAAVLRRRS